MRDIFDTFLRFSGEVQRLDRIRSLQYQIKEAESTCGSCELWMTNKCHRESKTKKVSMGEAICNNFIMNIWTQNLIDKKQIELKSI